MSQIRENRAVRSLEYWWHPGPTRLALDYLPLHFMSHETKTNPYFVEVIVTWVFHHKQPTQSKADMVPNGASCTPRIWSWGSWLHTNYPFCWEKKQATAANHTGHGEGNAVLVTVPWFSPSQTVVSRPATAASSENLLKTQILGPRSDLLTRKLWNEP